jgi:hypothetical protein
MESNRGVRTTAAIALAIAASLAGAGFHPMAAALGADASAAGRSVAGMPPVAKALGTPAPDLSGGESGRNLLANADFTRGAGKSPDDWRTGGWKEAPSVTGYDWLHSAGSEPELVVTNFQPNDARWIQSLSLGPGWYYVSAEVRTEQVPSNAAGASVSLDEDGINSSDLRGTTDWQRLGLYLKVGKHGADIDVALRLGNFGSLNTGRALFRKASVVKLAAPAAGATPVFDLAAVRKSMAAPPIGHLWTLLATFALLAILALAGWNIYGAGELAPAPPPPRAERRRRQGSGAQGGARR